MKTKYIKRIVSLLSMLLCISSLSAQKEAANWFFGNQCGLNFINTVTRNDAAGIPVTGVPTNQSSPMHAVEGCFSMSDKDGNLIVFSDGERVYNKNKTLIQSGLKGNYSSTQSGVLIPWPERPGYYIVISNQQHYGYTGGIFYSLFNEAGNGGNGSFSVINIPLQTGGYVNASDLYENVAAVKHANGKDYWLVNRTGRYLFAWLITSSAFTSVDPTVVSVIPGTLSTTPMVSEGYLKMSPDGKLLCHANIDAPNGEILLADFDNSTGRISNIKIRNWGGTTLTRPYGIEFSPNGQNMFFSYLNANLYVMPTNQFMTGTPTLLTTETAGAIQMAPDGRLYTSKRTTQTLGIVPNPNDNIGNIKIHILNNYLTGTAEWGLPNFPASFFDGELSERSFVCRGNSFRYSMEVSFTGDPTGYPVRLEWNWGDGSPAESQNIIAGQTTYKLPHNYMTPGKYTIRVTPYRTGGVALSPITVPANVVDCKLKVNRQIRINLPNTAEQNINQ